MLLSNLFRNRKAKLIEKQLISFCEVLGTLYDNGLDSGCQMSIGGILYSGSWTRQSKTNFLTLVICKTIDGAMSSKTTYIPLPLEARLTREQCSRTICLTIDKLNP